MQLISNIVLNRKIFIQFYNILNCFSRYCVHKRKQILSGRWLTVFDGRLSLERFPEDADAMQDAVWHEKNVIADGGDGDEHCYDDGDDVPAIPDVHCHRSRLCLIAFSLEFL